MGYRLGVLCPEILGKGVWLEHPKFYGYIDDKYLIKTKSFKYLSKILSESDIENKPDDFYKEIKSSVLNRGFEYSFATGPWNLSAEEFRTFLTLYNQDLNVYEHDSGKYIWVRHPNGFYFCDYCNDQFNKLLFHDLFWSNYNKIISWS